VIADHVELVLRRIEKTSDSNGKQTDDQQTAADGFS
jgi:hypothetical protein